MRTLNQNGIVLYGKRAFICEGVSFTFRFPVEVKTGGGTVASSHITLKKKNRMERSMKEMR